MRQPSAESINDALRQVINHAGGAKAVGARMYPALPIHQAQQRINDSLNTEHRQHFNKLELIYLLRLGRDIGCHDAMYYLAAAVSYSEPSPIDTPDELQALQRQFIDAAAQLKQMSQRIEALTRTTLQAVR